MFLCATLRKSRTPAAIGGAFEIFTLTFAVRVWHFEECVYSLSRRDLDVKIKQISSVCALWSYRTRLWLSLLVIEKQGKQAPSKCEGSVFLHFCFCKVSITDILPVDKWSLAGKIDFYFVSLASDRARVPFSNCFQSLC